MTRVVTVFDKVSNLSFRCSKIKTFIDFTTAQETDQRSESRKKYLQISRVDTVCSKLLWLYKVEFIQFIFPWEDTDQV